MTQRPYNDDQAEYQFAYGYYTLEFSSHSIGCQVTVIKFGERGWLQGYATQ